MYQKQRAHTLTLLKVLGLVSNRLLSFLQTLIIKDQKYTLCHGVIITKYWHRAQMMARLYSQMLLMERRFKLSSLMRIRSFKEVLNMSWELLQLILWYFQNFQNLFSQEWEME